MLCKSYYGCVICENEFKNEYLEAMKKYCKHALYLYSREQQNFEKAGFYNTFKRNIANTLKNYIHDMEHYIDNRLLEITNKNNIHNVYTEYLNYYKNKSNVNNNTQNDNNN